MQGSAQEYLGHDSIVPHSHYLLAFSLFSLVACNLLPTRTRVSCPLPIIPNGTASTAMMTNRAFKLNCGRLDIFTGPQRPSPVAWWWLAYKRSYTGYDGSCQIL